MARVCWVVLAALLSSAALALGCAGEPEGSISPRGDTSLTPSPAGTGGLIPEPLATPARVTEGDWIPPVLLDTLAQERGAAVWREAYSGPTAAVLGKEVALNGFLIGGPRSTQGGGQACPTEVAVRGTPDQDPLVLDYLPPNSFETHSAYVVFCPGGVVGAAARYFRVSDLTMPGDWPTPGFFVGYTAVERVVNYFVAPAAPVEGGTINGRPAVFVKPVIPEGFGPSHVFIAVSDGAVGYLEVTAYHLAFDEVLKIAQGAACPGC